MITILIIFGIILAVILILRLLPGSWRANILGILQIVWNFVWGILRRIPRPALIFIGVLLGTIFLFLIVGLIVHLVAFYGGNFSALKILFAVDFILVLVFAIIVHNLSGESRGFVRSLCLVAMVQAILILLMMKGPVFYKANMDLIWIVSIGLLTLLVAGFYANKKSNAPMTILMALFAVLALSFLSLPKSLDQYLEGWKLKDQQKKVEQQRKQNYARRDILTSRAQVTADSAKVYEKLGNTFQQFINPNTNKKVWVHKREWLTVVQHGNSIVMNGATPMSCVVMAVTNSDFKTDTLYVRTDDHGTLIATEAKEPKVVYSTADSTETCTGSGLLAFTKPYLFPDKMAKIFIKKKGSLNRRIGCAFGTTEFGVAENKTSNWIRTQDSDSSILLDVGNTKVEATARKLSSGDTEIIVEKK